MARSGPVPPYGEAIQQAVASGDLAKMKAVAKQAEEHIARWGNLPAALEALKLEIAKLEARGGASGSGGAGGTGGSSETGAGRSRSRSAKPKS